VYKSNIHGCGVNAVRTLAAYEMITEYTGEIILTSVADLGEKKYEMNVSIYVLSISLHCGSAGFR
jgi:SET domain-containing protein